MGKETKIGLAVISVLLVIFGVVLTRRLMSSGPATDDAAPPVANLAEPLLPQTVPPSDQPTMLETSSQDARPPFSQMSPPEDSSTKWRTSAASRDADESEPGTSFMPKADLSTPPLEARLVAKPETYAPPASRYEAPEAVAEELSPPVVEAQEAVPDASPDVETPQAPQATAAEPAPLPRELLREPAAIPATNEVIVPVAESAPMPEAAQPTVAPPQDYRAPERDFYSAAPTPAPTPTPAAAPPADYRTQFQPVPPPAQNVYTPTRVTEPPAAQPYQTMPSVEPNAGGRSYGHAYAAPAAPREEIVERRNNNGVYHVEPGDSFWKISQKMYGAGGYFKALQEHNRSRFPRPSDLNVGDEVATPTVDELHAKYSGLCPKQRSTKPGTPMMQTVSTLPRSGRTYVVEEGDTLYDIAKYELGDGQRWPELFQLNRAVLGDDIDYLKPGTTLALPATAEQPTDILTRQPATTLQR